ncbi:hypothetical protein ACFL7D_09950 [candidate division KSB1 bacterium]
MAISAWVSLKKHVQLIVTSHPVSIPPLVSSFISPSVLGTPLGGWRISLAGPVPPFKHSPLKNGD